jgi:hypothetical protein
MENAGLGKLQLAQAVACRSLDRVNFFHLLNNVIHNTETAQQTKVEK